MMLATESNTTTFVGRLRIRSEAPDLNAEQQRIERLLRGATLRPHGLPDSATLVIRRLRGLRALRMPLISLDTQHDPSWQQAVNDELDPILARAARPALIQVPPGANAVLFLDRAELMAAMAQDWLSGTLQSYWWWHEFLRGHDAARMLFKQWRCSPESLPAAFEILGARSRAVEFVRRLPESMISDLLAAMPRAHALPSPNVGGWKSESGEQVSTSSRIDSPEPQREQVQHPDCPPWLPWVPEASAAALSPGRRVLLGQALMLRRAPGKARTVIFQNEIARWQASQSAEVDDLALPDSTASDHAGRHHDMTVHSRGPQSWLSGANVVEPPTTQVDVMSGGRARAALAVKVDDASEKSSAAILSNVASTQNPSEPTSQLQPEIVTAYGGIFFLLNVALHLKLYADFTFPLAVNLELDIWDFLYLLGLRFVPRNHRGDDIFALLGRLARRTTGCEPGEHFNPPEDWRLPREWLDAFPEAFEWREEIRDGRLEVMHPAGFLLVSEQRETAAEPVKPLDRWLNRIAQYIEARLVRAFGRDGAVQFLCQIPARASLTSSHLDVTYPLNVYPVEIRKAGLDRNPGWIPAAGRFVAFHFE
jgi:hypothetical protein